MLAKNDNTKFKGVSNGELHFQLHVHINASAEAKHNSHVIYNSRLYGIVVIQKQSLHKISLSYKERMDISTHMLIQCLQ